MNNTFLTSQLIAYLDNRGYVATYFQANKRAYHHWKSNEHVLVPEDKDALTSAEILTIFRENGATELPAELELMRFQVYYHKHLKNEG